MGSSEIPKAGWSLLLGDTGKVPGSKGLQEQKSHREETQALRVARGIEEEPEIRQGAGTVLEPSRKIHSVLVLLLLRHRSGLLHYAALSLPLGHW